MRKSLLMLTAALALWGCSREELAKPGTQGEGEVMVTFNVATEDATVTKALADNDGMAAKVNHWVMEVRDSEDQVYARIDESGTEGVKTHTFELPFVKGQTYTVLFWADTKDSYNTDDLTDVKLLDAETSGYAANKDSRDAFSAVEAGFTTSAAVQKTITLKRPFAQLNVIFTKLDSLYNKLVDSTEYLKFKPNTFKAVAKVPTSFNVLTQIAGNPASQALSITASENYLSNYQSHKSEATLFMDYFFATSGSKDVVDIDFSFVSNGVTVNHSFTSVPFQRNYRTNIKGELLTSTGTWNVTIDPTWETPDYDVPFYVTSSIAEAQAYIAPDVQGSQKTKVVKIQEGAVKESDVKADKVENMKVVEFVLKTTSPKEVSFQLPAVGDKADAWYVTYENGYPTQNVSVSAPEGTKVIINAPSSHVEVTGTSYATIIASTNSNTLVIPAGCTVDNLVVKQGGLEIHGTVKAVTVEGTKETVFVRDCENLIQSVYDVLKEYIAEGYVAKLDGDTWNIVPTANWINYAAKDFAGVEGKVITVASAGQLALLAKNVLAGNTYEGYTIKLGTNIDLAGYEWTPIGIYSYRTDCADGNSTVTVNKPFNGTFDGSNYSVSNMKISVADNGKAYNGAGLFGYMKSGSVRNLKVVNPDIEGRLYVGSVVGFPYTGSSIENCHVSGDIKIVASWYCGGIAGNGYINTIKDCSVIGEQGSYIKGNASKYADGAAGYFGGIIGFRGEGGMVVDGCSVKNVEITAECNGLGGISGLLHYGNTVKNCYLENVSIKMNSGEASDIERLGLYAGGNNGTEEQPGWCINNSATGCTVVSDSGACAALVGAAGTGMPNPTCIIGSSVVLDDEGKVIAGTFQAIPASVVAQGYMITKNEDGLYVVVESDAWIDHAAKEYASKDASAKTITIATPAQLALLRNELAADYLQYSGYTVTISADLDLGKYIWSPIPATGALILDGSDHTISNMKINADNNYGNAFISKSYSTTIKNLIFDNAEVTRKDKEFSGNVYAVVTGYAGYYTDATFENVTVRNSKVSGYGKVGGIAGMAEMQGNTLTFKDCKVENTTLQGAYNVAGLIALFQYAVSGSRNTVKIENSTSEFTFIPTELPDRSFSERTVIDGLPGNYLICGQYYYAESAKYYCEYGNPDADAKNADAYIHNNPDNIIPE